MSSSALLLLLGVLLALTKRSLAVVDRSWTIGMAEQWPRPIGSPAGSFYRFHASNQVHGIDALYERFFGRVTVKTPSPRQQAVVIGAFDGVWYDATLGLALRGWDMYYVEPVGAHIAELRRLLGDLPRVRTLQAAVGGPEASGTAEILSRGVLSTLSTEWKHTFTEGEGFHHGRVANVVTEEVRLIPAAAVFRDMHVRPGLGVLVIDTEGLEWEVMQGIDLDLWRPVLIIVELGEDELETSADMQATAKAHRRCRQHLLASGYVPVYRDRINTVFARQDEAAKAGVRSLL